MKVVVWLGSSKSDLMSFPAPLRAEAGHQLNHVQQDVEPDDWKPMKEIGPGVREIRLRDVSGAYRLFYVLEDVNNVYVLHVFKKTSQKTAKHDIDLAKKRYKQIRYARYV